MKALNQQKTELFRNILFITLGSLLYALNFDLFLEPGHSASIFLHYFLFFCFCQQFPV